MLKQHSLVRGIERRARQRRAVELVRIIIQAAALCTPVVLFADDFTIPSPPKKPPTEHPAPSLEDSSAIVPMSIALADSFAKLDAAVPKHDPKWGAWNFEKPGGEWAYEYEFWRDPLRISLIGSQLSIGFDGRYKARGGHKVAGTVVTLGSCGDGEPLRQVHADLSTKIDLQPTWALSSKSNVSVSYPNRCEIKIAVFPIDVTGKINKIIQPRFEDAAKEIDTKIGSFDVRGKIQDAWGKLQSPIQLAQQTWLLINPKTVQVSPINGTGDQLLVSVGLVARPGIVYGAQPVAGTDPLPQLQFATPGNTFHVAIEGTVPFDDASKSLGKSIVGRRYTYAGNYETIEAVDLYGTGDQAVLQLKLGGTLKGTIYLTGTPSFDAATNRLTVPDLDYTVETNNIFAKLANWMNHAGFRDSLRAACHWDAGNQIATAQDIANKGSESADRRARGTILPPTHCASDRSLRNPNRI